MLKRGLATATPLFPDILDDRLVAAYFENSAALQAVEEFHANAVIPRKGVQSRAGESTQGYSVLAEVYSIVSTPHFWELAAVFPHNNIHDSAFRPLHGRPLAYPDWLLFLVMCIGARHGAASRRKALTDLRDPRIWLPLIPFIDEYVPAGWTRLADLPSTTPTLTLVSSGKRKKPHRPKVVPKAPEVQHLDYFMRRMRGKPIRDEDKKVIGYELDPLSEYVGIVDRLQDAFRASAIALIQSMGALDPNRPLQYGAPHRDQFVRFDGTVFGIAEGRQSTTAELHATGGGTKFAYGTKYTIASARIDGQYHSRVFLGFEHNGPTSAPEHRHEAISTVTMAKMLAALADGGMKGMFVDSIIRGNHVTYLQRHGQVVVNWPYAQSNKAPKKAKGKKTDNRKSDDRVEKSHLATVCIHTDDSGLGCRHPLYWVGGDLCEAVTDVNGDTILTHITPDKYEVRLNKDGTRREYFLIHITCPHASTPVRERVSLFHVDGTSTSPQHNFGEVARVYGPSNPNFAYLYGGRNDAESRHTNLKARIKYLPSDVFGQSLRILAAMVTSNCVSYQWHLKHMKAPNQIDGVA